MQLCRLPVSHWISETPFIYCALMPRPEAGGDKWGNLKATYKKFWASREATAGASYYCCIYSCICWNLLLGPTDSVLSLRSSRRENLPKLLSSWVLVTIPAGQLRVGLQTPFHSLHENDSLPVGRQWVSSTSRGTGKSVTPLPTERTVDLKAHVEHCGISQTRPCIFCV